MREREGDCENVQEGKKMIFYYTFIIIIIIIIYIYIHIWINNIRAKCVLCCV